MADTGTVEKTATAPITDPLLGKQTSTESALSNYVGPYVTEMLGKGQALGNTGYEAYGGPLTAGESALQTDAFSGVAGLTVPTDQMGAFTPKSFNDAGVADTYMNPYLTGALNPSIDAARRQAEIQRVNDAGRLTKAGAFGGSRQALMEAEGNRGLLDRIAGITGTGYANAYDKAMQQFNTEQGRDMEAQDMTNQYGLGALIKQLEFGSAQRGIEGEGIAADKAQFEEERDFPYKQLQYLQSLLQGLPLATQSYTYQGEDPLSAAKGSAGGIMELFDLLYGNNKAPVVDPVATNTNQVDIEDDLAGNTE